MPVWLGIDYGSRRIGIAVADDETRIALPTTALDGRNDPTRDARIVIEFASGVGGDSVEFVVGLPLNMDGTDSDQTRLTRRFANELHRLSGRPVHPADERLSSYAADEALDAAAVPADRRKGRRDAVAAQQILQAWLDQQAP